MSKKTKGGQAEQGKAPAATAATASTVANLAAVGAVAAAPLASVATPAKSLGVNITLHSIEFIDIGYTTALFGIPSLFVATLLNEYVYAKIQIGDKPKDEDKTTMAILCETLLCLTINGIVAYILRNLLQMIPFPLAQWDDRFHVFVMDVASLIK